MYTFRVYYNMILLLVSIILLSGCAGADWSEFAEPKAVNGVMDLSGWNKGSQPIVALDGEWEFYWKKLHMPNNLRFGIVDTEDRLYVPVPNPWNEYSFDGKALPSAGYATYRLRVLLPPGDDSLALRIPAIETAYTLWINGVEVASAGKVGKSKDESKARYKPSIVTINAYSSELDMTLQVSNFDHRRAGVWNSISLGRSSSIVDSYRQSIAIDMFLIGSLFVMGLYQMGIFLLQKNEKAPLYFSLFCMLLAVRGVMTGEMTIYLFIKMMRWSDTLRIQYAAFYLSLPSLYMFVRALYPREASAAVMRIVIGFGAAFTVLALVLPFPLVTMVVVPYQIFTVLISLYVLYVLINAVRYSRDGAVLALIGCGVLALSVLVDILYYNNVTSNGNVVPVGIIVSIFTTALIISIRMAKTYREAEVLSRRMQEMNAGLERKVRERTLDLEESNQHLERVNGDLARLEKSRRQLLSNISHDLGTPITLIQGYVEALLDGIVERPEQQQKYLRLIHSRVTGLSRLIQDLFQLSKLEARQISFSIQEITVEEYVRHFYERYELEVKNAGLTFDFQVSSPPGGMGGYVQVDLDRMDQVYTNVIYNAVKYTPAGGKIRLVYSVEESLIVTKIIDTGCGIEQEDLPYIFDRFYMKDKSRNSAAGGSGLGLSIAKEIVEFHGGNIWAESRVHQGTSICFLLPVSYRSLVS